MGVPPRPRIDPFFFKIQPPPTSYYNKSFLRAPPKKGLVKVEGFLPEILRRETQSLRKVWPLKTRDQQINSHFPMTGG